MVTLNHRYETYMRFHLAPFYLFLDDLKRSSQGHIFSIGCVAKSLQDKHIVIIPSPIRGWDSAVVWFDVHYYSSSSVL